MPSLTFDRVPKYRKHRASGLAVVTIGGRDIYLGPHGSAASRKKYRRRISEWLALDRAPVPTDCHITVIELIRAYWLHAKRYYIKNGKPTSEVDSIRSALRPVKELYGHLPAEQFGPRALKAVRQEFIKADHCRSTINDAVGRIRRMFRWGVAEELLPVTVYQALATVDGLRAGRCNARESKPVLPVAPDIVEATIPFLPLVVADMVRVQLLTGCRPGDVCIVRPCDIDMSENVWIFQPESHKTEHFGHKRAVFVGPRGQMVLRPYLVRAADDYCFSPAESEHKRRAQQHAARVTPLNMGNRPGTNRRRRPKRTCGKRYEVDSYRRAIYRAVELANRQRRIEAERRGEDPQKSALLERGTPNRLRHTTGTEIRRRHGLEAAQVALGHARADVTEIYAERNLALGRRVMEQEG